MEGKVALENLKVIYIVITTMWSILFAYTWNNKGLANFLVKFGFIILSLFGLILILSDLNGLNTVLEWIK